MVRISSVAEFIDGYNNKTLNQNKCIEDKNNSI